MFIPLLRKALREIASEAAFLGTCFIAVSSLFLNGCQQNGSSSSARISPSITIEGRVTSGAQALSGSAVQLYEAGREGIGSSAQPLLSEPVRTDGNGKFSISNFDKCPSMNSNVYIAAKGGNPGLTTGTDNGVITLVTMLGPCGSLSASTFIFVNEATTVGAVSPVSSYMRSVARVGTFPNDPLFPQAVSLARQLVDVSQGLSPGTGVPDGYTVPTTKVHTLANALATCTSSAGGVAGDGSACGRLFALATPPGGTSPTDTASAAMYIARNPSANVAELFAVGTSYAAFQPALTAAPDNFSLALVASTTSPVILPVTGAYVPGQSIKMTTATKGAKIYYTLDGSTPTTSSLTYSTPLTLSMAETVNAVSYSDTVASAVSSVAYTVSNKTMFVSIANIPVGTTSTGTAYLSVAAPASLTISLTSNLPNYVSVQPSVTIPQGQTSAKFTYTGVGVGIAAIKATSQGYADYTRGLGAIPTAPVFSLASGSYTAGQTVSLSSASGTVIRYTLDGTVPTPNSSVYSAPLTLASSETIRAIATAQGQFSSPSSATYIVTAPTLLFFTQPANLNGSGPFTPAPSVNVVDSSGKLLPSSTIPVTLSLSANTAGAVLTGVTTVNAVNGVATFPGLGVNTAGTSYTLIATSPGATPSVSKPFTVSLMPFFLLVSNVPVGSTAVGTITISTPAVADVPVSISSSMPQFVSVSPAMVVIPAGKTSVTFKYTGNGVGLAMLTANAPGYITTTRGLAGVVATPVPLPTSGTYSSGTMITLTSNPTAVIYYTLDGSTPTPSSPVYTKALILNVSETVQAIAIDSGHTSALLTATYALSSDSLRKYYISNLGDDSNKGTSPDTPWKHLSKLDGTKMVAGATAYLDCGSTFREKLPIQRTGTADLPLTYTSYGTCASGILPVISGADLLTGWTAEPQSGFTAYYAPETLKPTLVLEDNHRLPLVTSKSALTVGTSFFDITNKRVYLRTREDDDPTAMHTLEASVRPTIINSTMVSHLRIIGLEMDKAYDTAVLFTGNSSDIQLINTVTNYSKASGIRFSSNTGESQSNILVKGCTASYNGGDGVEKGNGGDNVIFDGCTANYDAFDPAYRIAAALHFVSDGSTDANRVTNSGIRNSTAGWAGVDPDTGALASSATLSGIGVFCDTCGNGSFLTHNIAHDSVQAGVQMEFSGTTGSRTVSYNISYGNFYGVLHTRRSHNDVISNNTTWGNFRNCQFSGEYGGGETKIGMVNNTYQNNICASYVENVYGTVFTAQWGPENNKLGEGSGNIYRNNSFGVPTATNGTFAVYGATKTVTSYAALDAAYGSSMHSITGDPLLTSPATGDFSLRPGSPAIGAGVGGVDLGAVPYKGN